MATSSPSRMGSYFMGIHYKLLEHPSQYPTQEKLRREDQDSPQPFSSHFNKKAQGTGLRLAEGYACLVELTLLGTTQLRYVFQKSSYCYNHRV